MKAMVFSDSHGHMTTFEQIVEKAWQHEGLRDENGNVRVDAYFFLGDGVSDFERMERFLRRKTPNALMYAVKGNNDFGANAPYSRVVRFGGANIFMTHGYHENVKLSLLSLDLAAQQAGCTIALYGHTHCQDEETRRVTMINPGSVGSGHLALLEVEDGVPRVKMLRY